MTVIEDSYVQVTQHIERKNDVVHGKEVFALASCSACVNLHANITGTVVEFREEAIPLPVVCSLAGSSDWDFAVTTAAMRGKRI